MAEKKEPTPFIVNGVYKRSLFENRWHYAVLAGGELHGSGRRRGVLVSSSQAPLTVIEGTEELNEWTLESVPVPVDVMTRLEAALFGKIDEFELRIGKLESAPKVPSPLDDLRETASRLKKVV